MIIQELYDAKLKALDRELETLRDLIRQQTKLIDLLTPSRCVVDPEHFFVPVPERPGRSYAHREAEYVRTLNNSLHEALQKADRKYRESAAEVSRLDVLHRVRLETIEQLQRDVAAWKKESMRLRNELDATPLPKNWSSVESRLYAISEECLRNLQDKAALWEKARAQDGRDPKCDSCKHFIISFRTVACMKCHDFSEHKEKNIENDRPPTT